MTGSRKTLALIETESYVDDAAWHTAVETWLLEHRFISVSKREEVLPGFLKIGLDMRRAPLTETGTFLYLKMDQFDGGNPRV